MISTVTHEYELGDQNLVSEDERIYLGSHVAIRVNGTDMVGKVIDMRDTLGVTFIEVEFEIESRLLSEMEVLF